MEPLNVEQIAQLLKCSARRIQQYVKLGMPREKRGFYDPLKCSLWLNEYLLAELQRRGGGTLVKERERLVKAQADREELELAQKRGELIPVSVHEERLMYHLTTLRQNLLALPGRVAPRLEGLPRQEIKGVLSGVLNSFLKLNANGTANTTAGIGSGNPAGGGAGVQHIGAGAGPEDQRVG